MYLRSFELMLAHDGPRGGEIRVSTGQIPYFQPFSIPCVKDGDAASMSREQVHPQKAAAAVATVREGNINVRFAAKNFSVYEMNLEAPGR